MVPLGSDEGQIHVKRCVDVVTEETLIQPPFSVQSRVVVPDDEIEDQEGSTQLLFAEWDPEADQDHKARLVKYAKAIFCKSLSIAHDTMLTRIY